jgi:DNA-binding response OmpR family regulator/DNA-binding CsgD family transcriptional regulator
MKPDEPGSPVVLVVDDTPDTLRFVNDALDAAGMTVVVAVDGASAIRIARRMAPDVVLLDAVMPGMDGFETCRLLKSEPTMSGVPIIFMTGLSETDDIVRAFEAGGVDYLTKPIVVEEMLARIHAHIANARLTRSARAALDVSGRFLFAVSRAGAVVWATPRAQELLAELQAGGTPGQHAPWASWFGDDAPHRGGAPNVSPPETRIGDMRVVYVDRLWPDEFLLQFVPRDSSAPPPDFGRRVGLTEREGQVLYWLTKGKANRDIAEILGLSTRTIDKHLQQIYAKLEVENRTSATAIAVQLLRERGGR